MEKKIKIGSRGSKLSLIYARIAINKIILSSNLKEKDIEIIIIKTEGDQVQDRRLSEVGGKGLFSKDIENELRKKKIDIAVHALKDMPTEESPGLITNTFLERNDPREILITKDKKKLMELKTNAIIGTSSYRREFQIKKIRPDLNCKLIRGNIDTRIKKLNKGLYDGIMLSYAGIKFLNFNKEVSEIFPVERFIPSAGQGVIALQCRERDSEIISILKKVNHKETYQRVLAERNLLKVLEGDCATAVGAHAVIEKDKITLEAELFSLDGKNNYHVKKSEKIENAKKLGIEIGHKLKIESNNSYKK